MSERTLCFLTRENPSREVLLGLKKIGFGAGKYAGFGGRVESGESIEAATVRELEEETSIRVSVHDLYPIGRLHFLFPSKPNWSQVVHVFLATVWAGNPEESDEMKPTWCGIDQIPFESMWDYASYWVPLVVQGKRIKASFLYKYDNDTVGEATIEEWYDSQEKSVSMQ
jgi:8-oxo-dGTP diphosphatase